MSGIFVSRAPAGKPRCARCHRPFTPKHEGDRYGQTCAKIVAAMQTLEYVDLKKPGTVIV